MDPADAFADWLACAVAGRSERAARVAAVAGDVARAGAAGHVLDFDDTWLPGLAHLSAPVAPAALVAGASEGASLNDVLAAYAAGVEAMADVAGPSHPALYEAGWHPTAVCGAAGAAVAVARLLGCPERDAAALALTRAGGLQAAFGSDAKALQVGLAAAAGADCARLVAEGARVDAARLQAGFEAALGARVQGRGGSAFDELWIKPWPCCLQTHGAIEAALQARAAGVAAGGAFLVVVHPVSRRAAALDDVASGLEAKFSIPYAVALALRHGEPGVDAFAAVDPVVRADAARVGVVTDPSLLESEARLERDGAVVGHTRAAIGSPQQPLDPERREAKIRALGGLPADELPGPREIVGELLG